MTFDKLLEEVESDFGRINFRERVMLRRAYDVMPEKKMKIKIFIYSFYWAGRKPLPLGVG